MKTPAEYLAMLEHSFQETSQHHDDAQTRAEFLSMHVFNFTTYDGDQDEIFVSRAVEVCRAISTSSTHAYIGQSPEHYTWYLIMCNMPFFSRCLNWGGSIRGAWWSEPYDGHGRAPIVLTTCGLYEGDEQIIDPEFTSDEWKRFIDAVMAFAAPVNQVGG